MVWQLENSGGLIVAFFASQETPNEAAVTVCIVV
jgi:hypothetical protein